MILQLQNELSSIKQNGLWRELKIPSGVDFSSNDYLGLTNSESIRKRLITFLENSPNLGSTGSRLISGESEIIKETENFIANIFKIESVLFFGSGYLANLGVLSALTSNIKTNIETEFFSDELNHSSIIDGICLSKCKVTVFAHNDLCHLENCLMRSPSKRKIIVTESTFSMDGDSPDIQSLIDLVEKYNCFLVLDEAHSTGVCGKSGLGLLEDLRYDPNRIIAVHTCGKALGAYGAFVNSSESFRKLLINKSRPFIFSTALPPMLIAQVRFAMEELIANPSLRIQLDKNIKFISHEFQNANLSWIGKHIGFVLTPGNERALKASKFLLSKGFHTKAIRSPTVAPGKERLRLTVKSFHKEIEIQELVSLIAEVTQ
jgi:8-amino-7-oxononanoate synthase